MTQAETARLWTYRSASDRRQRQFDLVQHNREMLKLRVNGQAYRDKLISERLRLRSTSEHHND